jgi:hypothetical protein
MNVYVRIPGASQSWRLNVIRNAGGWQGCVDLPGSCFHGKIKDFLHRGAEKASFLIYLLDIIDKLKNAVTFPLQSPSMICNICKNNVAAGA